MNSTQSKPVSEAPARRTPKWVAWVLGFIFQLGLGTAPAWANDASHAEQAFFVAYDRLHQAAVDFETGLKAISPPQGFTYSQSDLVEYRKLLDHLFTTKPEYRTLTVEDVANDPKAKELAKAVGRSKEELALHKEAAVVARLSGLPHRELAVYQKAKGTSGLRSLLQSVKNLQNAQWIAWYLTLTNNGDPSTEKALQLNKGPQQPEAVNLREAYSKVAREFNQAREALQKADDAAFKAAKTESEKSRLAVRTYIHGYIATRSGKVGWLAENRASYPYTDANPKQYPQVAELSEKLGIPFADLAYIKKREGDYGLKKVLKTLTWVKDMDSIISDAEETSHSRTARSSRGLGRLLKSKLGG